MKLDTVTVLKNSDPICWDMAKQEYIDSLIEDDQIYLSPEGNHYYWISDIEKYLDKNLEPLCA